MCEDQNLFVHVEEIKGEVFMRRMSRMSDTNGRKRVKEKVGFKPMFGWFYMVYFWAFQLYQPYMIENWNQQYILIGRSKCLSKVSLLPIFIAMMAAFWHGLHSTLLNFNFMIELIYMSWLSFMSFFFLTRAGKAECWVGLFPSCGGKPKAQTFKAS